MDLDANGIVTWTFMTPDKLERYRPAASPALPNLTNAPTPAGSSMGDPYFPKQQERLELAPNDFTALSLAYSYEGQPARPLVTIYFGSGFGARMTYLGYNEDGAWLADNPLDAKRLYTYKNGAHIPIPDSIACNMGNCVATGVLTRHPYATALPNNLRNRPAVVAAPNDGPPGWKASDPNFPKQNDAYVALAPNEFGAEYINYGYGSDGNRLSNVSVNFTRFGELMTYLGFNDEGAWLAGGQNNVNRLFVFKGGQHIPIPDSANCQNGGGGCWAGGTLTRKPFSTAVPANLNNSPDNNRAAKAGTTGFGHGMTAAEEAAIDERAKVLQDLDQQVKNGWVGIGTLMWQFDHDPAKSKQLRDNYNSWMVQREKDCGLVMLSASEAPTWRHAAARKDSTYNCYLAKSRERIAAYQKVVTEIAAKNVTPESWAAVASTDQVKGTTGNGPAPEKTTSKNDRAQQLFDLDLEARAMQGRVGSSAMQKFGRGGSASRIANAYEQWKAQRERDCAPPGTRPGLASTDPAILDCMIAKTRERIALYQKAMAELEAGKLSTETGAAIGLR
jgi:hypothetical protein